MRLTYLRDRSLSTKKGVGEKVGVDEFPWIVSLHDLAMTLNGHPVFFCTGALLDPTHVLTAAHCLDESSEEVMVNWQAITKKISIPSMWQLMWPR